MYDPAGTNPDRLFLFYDLETSGRYPIGQILSASFRLTDGDINEIPGYRLNLYIRLSPTELPEAGAILVNKISLAALGQQGISEYDACIRTDEFIRTILTDFPDSAVYLTGFNSNRFDLPFLRTVLIRNGFSPYFPGRLLYADSLEYARFIAFTREPFDFAFKETPDGSTAVTFSLESLSKRYGFLTGRQLHDSEDDTRLLAVVTKHLHDTYPGSLEAFLTREIPEEPFAYYTSFQVTPSGIDKPFSYASVHAVRGNALLYIDLNKFAEDPAVSAVHYLNTSQSGFCRANVPVPTDRKELAKVARKTFSGLNLHNFFQKTDCDIEQDIYRLPIRLIAALGSKIRNETVEKVTNQDFRRLYRRFFLRNPERIQDSPVFWEHYRSTFDEYVQGRYVAGLKLNRFGDSRISRRFDELEAELLNALTLADGDDRSLMQELLDYYQASPVAEAVSRLQKH